MPCEECRELRTHRFSSHTDLVNALQVAASEVDRGVLAPVPAAERSIPEQVAIGSALESGAFPDVVLYRFKCTVCGDGFELAADTNEGKGQWSRNGEQSADAAEADPAPSKIYKRKIGE
jgi:hypothetical protein